MPKMTPERTREQEGTKSNRKAAKYTCTKSMCLHSQAPFKFTLASENLSRSVALQKDPLAGRTVLRSKCRRVEQ